MTAARFSLAPEEELLLLTAAVSPRETAMRRLVSEGIHWDTFATLVQDANAAPIVVRQLARLDAATTDAGQERLRRLGMLSVMRMLQLEQLLHQTIDALAGRGIEVMLLKGAALASTAYPSFADRPMSDLDLLIRPPDQSEAAWTWLQTRGWTWPSERWERARYTTLHHLPPLIQRPPAGGAGEEFRLEVHSDLLPGGHPFRLSADEVWTQAQRVSRGDRVVLVPHALHRLWHVCVHFAWSHGMRWGAWRSLRDVGTILAGADVAWMPFVELARESRAETCCYWTLRLARRLTEAPVPDDVLDALRPPRPEVILDRLERHYVLNFFSSEAGCPSVLLSNLLWEAGILPRWSGHGAARPWQVDERWAAGAAKPPAQLARPRWARFGRLAAGWRYLRRIQRLSLPRSAA